MLRGRAQLFLTNPRITMMKNWVSHILFLRKRELIVHLAALKKGAFQAAHPYYVIYRMLPPPPEHRNGAVLYPQCIKNLLIK